MVVDIPDYMHMIADDLAIFFSCPSTPFAFPFKVFYEHNFISL